MSSQETTLSLLLCGLLLHPGPNSASSNKEPLSPQATLPRMLTVSQPEASGTAELRLPGMRCPEELLRLSDSPSHTFAARETHMAMSRDR